MPKHAGKCDFQPAKRGDFEACTTPGCSERFPCAGNDCGHLDCIERRGKPPRCHFCSEQVAGPRGELWNQMLVHGHTRAGHYACRDAKASPAERVRTGAPLNP